MAITRFFNTQKMNYSSIDEYSPIKLNDYNKYDEFYHFLIIDIAPDTYLASNSECCLTRGFHPDGDFERAFVFKGNEMLQEVLFRPEFTFSILDNENIFDACADKLFNAICKIDKIEKLHGIRIDVIESKIMYKQIKILVDKLVEKITHYDKSIKIVRL